MGTTRCRSDLRQVDTPFELFQRLHQGDGSARDVLVTANLRFVVSVARDYKDYGLPLMELVSEGNTGLLEAIERFDETRGFKFITYAVWWIRQAILKSLSAQGMIAKPPMSRINDRQKIDKQSGLLAHRLGRTPTFDELADHVDISLERAQNAVALAQQDVFLDAPAYEQDETTLMDLQAADTEGADETLAKSELNETLGGCLETLDRREYEILRDYFGLEDVEPLTLEEIGDALGVTRERVRQLRNRALDKIRGECRDRLVEFSNN
jgi:RNA polymerase primary sigma factor